MEYSYADLEPYSFRDAMERAREAKQTEECRRWTVSRCAPLAWKRRPRLVEWWSVPMLSEALGISAARVKFLCGEGRIVGAKRLRVGKGAPWAIPARWNGKEHIVTVTPGSRGPRMRKSLSPSEEVPF